VENAKRLVPYSLYLPEEMHAQLKLKAKNRQASSMVRDAITMILEGNDYFTAGYKQAITDSLRVVNSNETVTAISLNGINMADVISNELNDLALKK